MKERYRQIWKSAIILYIFTLVVFLLGCSNEKTGKNIGAIEGDASLLNMVSMGSGLTPESEENGTWEWTWLCQEEGYAGNYIQFSIVHPANYDSSEILGKVKRTAGEIFNKQKQSLIEDGKIYYSGDPRDQQYWETVISEGNDFVAVLKEFPNQGEPLERAPDDIFFMGHYEGKAIVFREPACIGYVTMNINRDIFTSWPKAIEMLRTIKILGNE